MEYPVLTRKTQKVKASRQRKVLQGLAKKKPTLIDSNTGLARITSNLTLTAISAEDAPQSVLSLVVSSEDTEMLEKCLQKLAWLAKNRNVKVGNVYIVGLRNVAKLADPETVSSHPGVTQEANSKPWGQLSKLWFDKNYKLLSDAGFANHEIIQTQRLFDRLDISYSPTWVVRHLGRDYILEGYTDPSRYFTKDGEFIADEPF